MRQITIQLAGEELTVPQLTIRQEIDWRRQAGPLVGPLVEMAMAAGMSSPTPERLAKFGLAAAGITDPAALLDVLCAYGPTLAERRDWIADHAYTDELLLAVVALFFGQMAGRSANGAAPPLPTTILPS